MYLKESCLSLIGALTLGSMPIYAESLPQHGFHQCPEIKCHRQMGKNRWYCDGVGWHESVTSAIEPKFQRRLIMPTEEGCDYKLSYQAPPSIIDKRIKPEGITIPPCTAQFVGGIPGFECPSNIVPIPK